MLSTKLINKITTFRQLHSQGGLLLNNVWDVMSAHLAEKAGATAIATTSAGVAWSMGYADGHTIPRKCVMQHAAAIVASTELPVSIDVENGLLSTGENMSDLAQDLLAAGVAGVNLEDTQDGSMLDLVSGAQRIQQLRDACHALGYPLFINARMDVLLRGGNKDADSLINRAQSYIAAGADGVFIPGLIDLTLCQQVARAIDAPLSVMALSGAPSANEIFATGVKRYSAGSFMAESAYSHVLAQMQIFQQTGYLQPAESHLSYGEMNQMIGSLEIAD
ncbi:isocitrate lyase/phosphoenolpyruvate mutase family protein [Shewanella sp. CG12_big_fil_rev_8_21_14_0_65_47_15]|uniref:isocitrate lyase/PEP mutase family protein n=1 Tax=Shewanella sp. CG12_big_fil_rev_8_21_14_0_65_47_15 TaxID=1975537 RepID=UPI000CB072FA|nr:isocitrate lyase/phosphoenolpyruvate mutase family protein [Shewanella sp. CG12_big_fil_rev_8_21_14_0_65_47_15]PIW63063.1 MAG: 3-methyl-2-oxobutanoate hydroxymethyltransferase [Shewanella sp. CG12_big_fil_rev_8_21_14_0_65_47_15]